MASGEVPGKLVRAALSWAIWSVVLPTIRVPPFRLMVEPAWPKSEPTVWLPVALRDAPARRTRPAVFWMLFAPVRARAPCLTTVAP